MGTYLGQQVGTAAAAAGEGIRGLLRVAHRSPSAGVHRNLPSEVHLGVHHNLPSEAHLGVRRSHPSSCWGVGHHSPYHRPAAGAFPFHRP